MANPAAYATRWEKGFGGNKNKAPGASKVDASTSAISIQGSIFSNKGLSLNVSITYQFDFINNQWVMISYVPAYMTNPNWLHNNISHETTDNLRLYDVELNTFLITTSCGGLGENIWRNCTNGFWVEDDDLYYNPFIGWSYGF